MQHLTVKAMLDTFQEPRVTVSYLAARRTLEYTFESSQALLRIENVQVQYLEQPATDMSKLRMAAPCNVFVTNVPADERAPKICYSLNTETDWVAVEQPRTQHLEELTVDDLPRTEVGIGWGCCRIDTGYISKDKASQGIGIAETVYRVHATDVPEHLRKLVPNREQSIREIVIYTQPYTKGKATYERVVGMRYYFDHLPELAVRFTDSWKLDPRLVRVAEYAIDLRWRCGVITTQIGMTLDVDIAGVWVNFSAGIPTPDSWADISRVQNTRSLPRTMFEAQQQSEPFAKGAQA